MAVSLLDVGVWMPEEWMDAAALADASGIPEEVFAAKYGLDGKHIAGPGDHVSTMGARAAAQALERTGVAAADLDLVVYFGSMWKDYSVWSASPKIQQLLGAVQQVSALIQAALDAPEVREPPPCARFVVRRVGFDGQFQGIEGVTSITARHVNQVCAGFRGKIHLPRAIAPFRI